MARLSAYTASTLTVTLKESLTIDGRDYGGSQAYSFTGIGNVTRRLETITTTKASILSFASAIAAGTYIPGNVKYLRFTNLDDTNFITLFFTNAFDDVTCLKLDAGQSMAWNGDSSSGMVGVVASLSVPNVAFTDATCDYNNDPTVSCDASALIRPGLGVTGTGIPAAATVISVNTPGAVTSFELSASTTGGSVTNGTLTFSSRTAGLGLSDLKTIEADADQASSDLEIFVAS